MEFYQQINEMIFNDILELGVVIVVGIWIWHWFQSRKK